MTKSKYSDWTKGQVESLINIIGEENVRELLAGNLKIRFEKVIKSFFDRHGRRISQGLLAKVCDPNRQFRLDQPDLDQESSNASRITRLHQCLDIDTGITAEQFQSESHRLLTLIGDNPQIANLARGVCLPVVLPQLIVDDLGTELELYLDRVGKSYAGTFSGRKFHNHRKGELVGKVSIVQESRQDHLIERMRQGPVIGLHFPNPLQGFSINASREQMSTLPQGFVLSGIDTVIAMIMYPDVLACGANTPGLDLASFLWQSADYSLCFGANDVRLDFALTDDLVHACGRYSGGLFFLG